MQSPSFLHYLTQILGYFKRSTPVNAAKVSTKLIDALVNAHAGCVERVLPALLDVDVLSLACSHDKLAFRLRLAGGALRACQGAGTAVDPAVAAAGAATAAAAPGAAPAPSAGGGGLATTCLDAVVLPLVLPIVTSPAFTHHTEKTVRKATCKLVKDLLKGLASFYPRGIHPSFPGRGVGAPNSFAHAASGWYSPTPAALAAAATVLRATAVRAMTEVTAQMATLTAAAGTSAPGATSGASAVALKKAEEAVVSGLKVVQKAVRGAAEVLGDAVPAAPGLVASVPRWSGSDAASSPEERDDFDRAVEDSEGGAEAEAEAAKEDRHATAVIGTGRDEVVQALATSGRPGAAADAALLRGLRVTALDFLAQLDVAFQTLQPSAPSSAASTAMCVDGAGAAAAAGATAAGSAVAGGLYNSASVQAAWCKLFRLVVNQVRPIQAPI